MISTILQTPEERKVCQQLDLGLLQEALPMSQIETLLDTYQMWEQRERQLNMVVMVYWLLGVHLYPHLSQRAVYARLVSGLRTVRDDVPQSIPVKSAFRYRRKQLGSEVMEELFAQCAGPQADEQTPGAFWHGMRLMGIDGAVQSLADTPSNGYCLRYSTDDEQTQSPFPQARLVLVVECGTHLICAVEISPCRQAEATSTRMLLSRWKWENCLVRWDSGFHSHEAIFPLRERHCHLLGRLKRHVLLTPIARLWDGSYLTFIRRQQGRRRAERMLVRVISSSFTDPRIPGAGTQVYRLVTTLLDPFEYPAKELAVLSHERWQVELVIDEADTHLRLCARTLRSQTPDGVMQELYALLLTHVLLRTLMLRAAQAEGLAPTGLSLTQTIALLEDSRVPLALVSASRREAMVGHLLKEMGTFRLPNQRVRIAARVVKRVHSRYDRKKPEHWHAPALELDLQFHQIIAVVEGAPIASSP